MAASADDRNNLTQQDEEVLALQSIFPDQFKHDHATKVCTVLLPDACAPTVELTICLPPNYPSHAPPSVTITGLPNTSTLLRTLHDAFTPGEVVLFTWVNYLLSSPESWQPRPREPPEPTRAVQQVPTPAITHGEPVTERKSTFQAHVATVHRYLHILLLLLKDKHCSTTMVDHWLNSVAEVHAVLAALQAVNKIRSATHNIMAYRIQHATGTLMQVAAKTLKQL